MSEQNPTNESRERMRGAYAAARVLIDAEMPREQADLLRAVESSDVVVVRGEYDHIEQVLDILEIPHTLVSVPDVDRLTLRPEQLLIINCPGNLSRKGVAKVREFVETGGSLFTTDWALKHVLEPAFPGIVAYNERPTADDVVRIEIKDTSSRFLQGVFHEGADPLWWLEGSSYPIRILAPEKVRVLLTSRELEEKWGESPVAVTFDYGRGDVFHMISHYYLQRAECRTSRHQQNWKAYAAEVGAVAVADAAPAAYDALSLGEVEAAHKSAWFMQNIIADKQRRNKNR